MERYQYEPLQDPDVDIRILTLLPGEFDDQITVQIHHVSLLPKEMPETMKRMTIEELQETVPEGWEVFETYERRFVFADPRGDTRWVHPAPEFEEELYSSRQEREVASVDYAALSYEWGPAQDMEEIYVMSTDGLAPEDCNTQDGWNQSPSILSVRQNLAVALRHIRAKTTPCSMWIDAVCINQEDNSERSKQVSRMQDIFTLAPRVLVWLGEASVTSATALSTLEYLGHQCLDTTNEYWIFPPKVSEEDWWDIDTPLPYDAETWDAIGELLGRSYFKRLWIWQEVILSDDRAVVQCGGEQTDWPTFRRAVDRMFQFKSNMPEPICRRLLHVYALSYMRGGDGFERYMRKTHNQLCVDPRDRIYAIRGLLDRTLSDRIHPDYELTGADVYREAVLAYLAEMKDLRIINQCDAGSRTVDGLPSWVPDWSIPMGRALADPEHCFASLKLPAQWQHTTPGQLKVLGVRCATLESVATRAIDPECVGETLEMLRRCFPPDLCTAQYITGEPLLDAYATTLCGNEVEHAFDQTSGSHGRITLADPQVLAKISRTQEDGIRLDTEFGNDPYVQSILRESWGSVVWRLRRVTSVPDRPLLNQVGHVNINRYPAIGRSSQALGDLVCVLLGYPAPLLLRNDKLDRFQIVGSVYIHGLMYGEALLGNLLRGALECSGPK
jgi:hypothetical protein